MGAPRMTRADAWKKRPVVLRYWEFKDELRRQAAEARFVFPNAGAYIVFHIPMPASWSKKERDRMRGMPHQSKPDGDNLEKALLDTLLEEDCRVWHIAGREKRWADEGCIEITIPDSSEEAA